MSFRRLASLSIVLVAMVALVGSPPKVTAQTGERDVPFADVSDALVALRTQIPSQYSYAFTASTDGDFLQVVTDGPLAEFDSVVRAFGTRVRVASGKVGLYSGRLADTSPFWGGAAINDGTSLCTSGWIAKSHTSSTKYLVTAGHCFPLNATIHANRFAGQGAVVGTVTKRDFPSYEAELISGGSWHAHLQRRKWR